MREKETPEVETSGVLQKVGLNQETESTKQIPDTRVSD